MGQPISVEDLLASGAEVHLVITDYGRRLLFDESGIKMQSVSPFASFAGYDAVVVITNHRALDWPRMLEEAQLIVDTRGALRKVTGRRDHIVTA